MLVSGVFKYLNVYRNEHYNTLSGTVSILAVDEKVEVAEKKGSQVYKNFNHLPVIKIKAYVTDKILEDVGICEVIFLDLVEAEKDEKRAGEFQGNFYKVKNILDPEQAEIAVRSLSNN